MDDNQEDKLSMYGAVNSIATGGAWNGPIGTVAALGTAFGALAHAITPLVQSATGQSTTTSQSYGATVDKRSRRNDLIIATMAVSGPLLSLGHSLSDNEITAVANISRAALRKTRDELLGPIAQGIHTLATTHAAALVARGVTAAHLTALASEITDWTAGTQTPRERRAAASGHRADLEIHFDTIDALLKQ